jgi:glucose-6-phosphate isomerase
MMADTDLPYRQSLDNCFAAAIGDGGLSRDSYGKALARAEEALSWLRKAYESGDLPLLRVPARRDDFARIEEVAEGLRNDTTDIFIFGIGGSALGAQALAQLTGWGTQANVQKGVRIHIPDNLDAATMDAAFSNADLRTTRFLVVSKSGGTVEPAIQTLSAMSAIAEAGGAKYMKHHFAVLTEPAKNGKPNPLRALAEAQGFPTLEHDPGVGGRYAVLTNVGLLPASLMGLDIEAVREGAASVLAQVLDGRPAGEVAPAAGAALSVAMAEEKGTSLSVVVAYADRLERFLAWYCQLWAGEGARSRRPAQPVAALARRAEGQALHRLHDGDERQGPEGVAGDCGGNGIRFPRRAHGGRSRRCRTARDGRYAREEWPSGPHFHAAGARRTHARRALHAFHAGNDRRGAHARRRSVRSAGGRRGQDPRTAISRRGKGLTSP